MLQISKTVSIQDHELDIRPTGSQGPGGQNVNKSATAVHLRFDVRASSLPDSFKERILACNDRRVTKSGVIVIKAQQYRSFEDNREEALKRLHALIKRATVTRTVRKPTRPGKSAKRKRLDRKSRRGRIKALRGRVDPSSE